MLSRCSRRARSKVGKPLACRSAVHIALEPFVGEFACVLSLVHCVDSFAKLRVRFAQPNSRTFPTALTIRIRVRPTGITLPCERFRGAGKEAILIPRANTCEENLRAVRRCFGVGEEFLDRSREVVVLKLSLQRIVRTFGKLPSVFMEECI